MRSSVQLRQFFATLLAAASLASAGRAQDAPIDIVASHEATSDALAILVGQAELQLGITSPSSGSVIAGNTVTVTGSIASGGGGPLYGEVLYRVFDYPDYVTLSEGSAPVVGGRFTIPDVILGTGDHVVEVLATDLAGNQDTDTLFITSDPSIPTVALVAPLDGSAALTSRVSVDLNFGEAMTVVAVNGAPDGRVLGPGLVAGALTLPLELGANIFTLELDGSSGPFTFSFTVFRVDSLASLRITAPGDGAFVNSTSQIVRGTVPRGTPFVTVNGVPAEIAADQVSFSASVPIREGANTIEAIAHPFGQSARIAVDGDFVPPKLLALIPEDGSVTHEMSLAFGGMADEPVRIELLGPGGEVHGATRVAAGPFSALHTFALDALELIGGSNAIEIALVDRAGNESVQTIEVSRILRALQLVAPLAGATVPGLRVDLELDALESVTLDAVYVAGRWLPAFAGQLLSPGIATLPGVLLVPGENEVRLVYHRPDLGEEVLVFALVADAPNTATIVGTVTDAQTGSALGGALISLTVNGTAVLAVTAPDGSYRLEVEPGVVVATATQSGFATETFLSETLGPDEVRTADASLDPWVGPGPFPGSVILVGSIRNDLTGALEAGVRVELLGSEVTVQSDSNGGFVLPTIPTGTQTLRFLKPGFRDEFVSLQLTRPADGLPIFRSFQFPLAYGEPGRLAISSDAPGFVRDDLTGAGLAGVTVTAGGATAVSGADGSFILTGLPVGTLEITASGAGHQEQTLEALVVANADDAVEFHLAALTQGRVVGTVTDAAGGAAIGGASVRVAGSTLLAAGTAGDGRYELAFVPSGAYDLEIVHPEYLTKTVSGVLVTNGDSTAVDISLDATPKTGRLTGTIRDKLSGDLISGAVVSLAGVGSSTTGGDGVYSLSSVPAGLVHLTISAPGLASTTRSTAVIADVDFATPAVNRADFSLDLVGSVPDIASKVVSAAEGGEIETPDKRLRLVVLPGSLTADAEIFLLTPDAPVVSPGDPLQLDPLLGLSQVTAVGRGVEIRVAPLQAGGPLPKLVGPSLVITRYPESDVVAANLSEASLFPYYHLESGGFTALQTVPHLHAVDRTNNITVSVLLFGVAQTGVQIAALGQPIQVAQLGGDLPIFFTKYDLQNAAAQRASNPYLGAGVIGIADDDERIVDDSRITGPQLEGALPFLVFHGWDEKALQGDVGLMEDPLGDARFGRMLRDLMAQTNGVYRPLFVTYNSRADLAQSAQAIARFLDPVIDQIGVGGRVPSLGFSMGGLAERTYQAVSRKVTMDPGGFPVVSRRVEDMITLATPHRGAAQLVELLTFAIAVAELGPIGGAASHYLAVDLMRRWSPGTMQLKGYDDLGCGVHPELSGNAFLCELNRNPASMPNEGLTLIGGTDPKSVDILGLVSIPLGSLIVGEAPNDGVVSLRSAHARASSGESIRLEKAREASRDPRLFNHFDVGKDAQPIESFARELILDRLTDWGAGQFTDPGGFPLQCPTQTSEGFVESTIAFDWNLPHESLTGLGVVVYVFDGTRQWRIASGADPASGAIEDYSSFEVPNSRDSFEPGDFTVTTNRPLPKLDLDTPDPSTRIIDAVSVAFPLGPEADVTDRVPADPTGVAGYQPPDLDNPICPCPEPSNPTCQ